MLGIDLHDATLVIQKAEGSAAAETLRLDNTPSGRRELWDRLHRRTKRSKSTRVVMAYEASSQGFGLYDEATDEGFECHVLAPTKIARSRQHAKRKTDEQDAKRLLEVVRGHVLAGNDLPAVWVPDAQTREDREIVRSRLDISEKLTALKAQIQTLLKRHGLKRPKDTGQGWTTMFLAYLRGLASPRGRLGPGARVALATLLRQRDALEEEIVTVEEEVYKLSEQPRYREPAKGLDALAGVGLLTAMVFLTELGDLRRFANRRQLAAYLGVVPSSDESGETNDRKGHITRQGPWRVRRVLCQCVWARLRTDAEEKTVYDRIAKKNPKHKKIGVVAIMRRLAVRMWHVGQDAQVAQGGFTKVA
jgi:transposase